MDHKSHINDSHVTLPGSCWSPTFPLGRHGGWWSAPVDHCLLAPLYFVFLSGHRNPSLYITALHRPVYLLSVRNLYHFLYLFVCLSICLSPCLLAYRLMSVVVGAASPAAVAVSSRLMPHKRSLPHSTLDAAVDHRMSLHSSRTQQRQRIAAAMIRRETTQTVVFITSKCC